MVQPISWTILTMRHRAIVLSFNGENYYNFFNIYSMASQFSKQGTQVQLPIRSLFPLQVQHSAHFPLLSLVQPPFSPFLCF